MMKQAEIWPSHVVKGDDFPVDCRVANKGIIPLGTLSMRLKMQLPN